MNSTIYFICGIFGGICVSIHFNNQQCVVEMRDRFFTRIKKVNFNIKLFLLNKIRNIYRRESLVQVSKKLYTLTYFHNNNSYTIMLPILRGPSKIFKIENEIYEDVTDKIKPYLGPNEDCHNMKITPKQLNYYQLTFCFRNGKIITFKESEIIDI
jgi:hypothetical protein